MDYILLLSHGIKRLRLSKNLTQEKFAEKIGLSVQGYRLIEIGKSQPLPATINTICTTFNISPVELLLPDTTNDRQTLENIIITKIKNYDVEKLAKINNVIDVI